LAKAQQSFLIYKIWSQFTYIFELKLADHGDQYD